MFFSFEQRDSISYPLHISPIEVLFVFFEPQPWNAANNNIGSICRGARTG